MGRCRAAQTRFGGAQPTRFASIRLPSPRVAANRPFHSRGDAALFAIAIFKFIKGGVLLALVCGAMSLFHKDVAAHVQYWLDQLQVDSDNRFVGALLAKLHLIHTKELKELSAIGAGYSALFLTEGTGLLFRQYWAEWLTIIATSSLIPFEVFQLVKQFTAISLLLLVGNLGIVLFLIYRVRQRRSVSASMKPGHEGRQSFFQSPPESV